MANNSYKNDSNHLSKNNHNLESSPDTKPRESIAVALEYKPESDSAPKVTASGYGHIAEKILQIAEENDINIHRDLDLTQILMAVDIDFEIPVEAFSAIAEILSFIYKENEKLKHSE